LNNGSSFRNPLQSPDPPKSPNPPKSPCTSLNPFSPRIGAPFESPPPSPKDESGILGAAEPTLEEPDLDYGTAFEKVEEYAHFLKDGNPWHPDIKRDLYPTQIIGFRWIMDRHHVGGGLIADKVGTGKVLC